jgi:phosphoribosylanthranilate isomerase
VDVSSGVESERGNKSKEKIIQFNKIVRKFDESKQ